MGIEINSSKICNDYSNLINTNNKEVKNGNFSDILNSKTAENKSTNLDEIFDKASKKYSIPVSLLKAIAKKESNFNTYAQSQAGAQGIMQLMPSTAKSLGVTNSFDQEQNIMGGAKYLRQMLDQFDGDTELALAAYNAGPGNVQKYGGIPPFEETQNYVDKVMGLCDQTININSNSSDEYISDFNMVTGINMGNIFSDGKISNEELELIINAYKYNVQTDLL